MDDDYRKERLCSYCLNIFPIQVGRYHEIQHHPNVEMFLAAADDCSMCRIIARYMPLENLRRRFPDITEARFDTVSLSVRLKEPLVSPTGISWGLLETNLESPEHTFQISSDLSITTCNPEGLLTSIISSEVPNVNLVKVLQLNIQHGILRVHRLSINIPLWRHG